MYLIYVVSHFLHILNLFFSFSNTKNKTIDAHHAICIWSFSMNPVRKTWKFFFILKEKFQFRYRKKSFWFFRYSDPKKKCLIFVDDKKSTSNAFISLLSHAHTHNHIRTLSLTHTFFLYHAHTRTLTHMHALSLFLHLLLVFLTFLHILSICHLFLQKKKKESKQSSPDEILRKQISSISGFDKARLISGSDRSPHWQTCLKDFTIQMFSIWVSFLMRLK